MDNKILGVIVASFVAIILGLVLFQTIVTQNYYIQNTETVYTKNFTLTNNTCSDIAGSSCIVSVTTVSNATSGVPLGSANYSLCSTGRSSGNNGLFFNLVGAQAGFTSGQTANITYAQSTSCMYVADGTARTLNGLVVIFFAIAIAVIALVYLRQTGVLDWF